MTTAEVTADGLASLLKESTAEAHRRAETTPFQKAFVGGAASVPHVAAYLGQLWFIHAAVERAAAASTDTSVEQLTSRGIAHSERLAEDLKALGINTAEVTPLEPTAAIVREIEANAAANPAWLVGPWYVLEGSMNGNQFIAKALAGRCAGTPLASLGYLTPYGDNQRAHWAACRVAIDQCGADRDATVAAALRTFDAIAEIGFAITADA